MIYICFNPYLPLDTRTTFEGSNNAVSGGVVGYASGPHSTPNLRNIRMSWWGTVYIYILGDTKAYLWLNESGRPLIVAKTGGCNQSSVAEKGTFVALDQRVGLYNSRLSGSALASTICFTMSCAKGPSRAFVSSPAWGTAVDLGPTI